MTKLNEELDNEFISHYGPKVKAFFESLEKLNLSESELTSVPSLFLPSCGIGYANSPLRIAIIGKETYGWYESLYYDYCMYKAGKYDILQSQRFFREETPAVWKGTFWQYVIGMLAYLYGAEYNDAMKKDSEIMKSFAWGNVHNVETWKSKAVQHESITSTNLGLIQQAAFDSGLAELDTFIDVFKPQVIIILYRNTSESESLKIIEKATFIKNFGEGKYNNNFISEYSYRGVTILHCSHPRHMKQSGMASVEEFAKSVNDIIKI